MDNINLLRTRKLIHRNSIVVSHTIFIIVAALDIALDITSSAGSKIGLAIFLGLFGALGVARYLNAFKINTRPKLHVLLYGLIVSGGVILFGKIGTIFVFSWLIIMFLIYAYYGIKASFGSLLFLAATLEGQLLFRAYQNGSGINQDMISVVLIQLGIISAMAMFFLDTESAAEKDRMEVIRSVDRAQLEHQRIISLINSMTDGVIATDEKGYITLYNASALSLLDTNQSLTGRKVDEVMHLVDKRHRKVEIIKLLAEPNALNESSDYSLKYGEKEYINLGMTMSEIKIGFGSKSGKGYVLTFRDITKFKSLEDERNEFISVISHELRTPVAVAEANISNAQFMIDKGQEAKTVKGSLDVAHNQIVYLAGMLNDLATLSRAENNDLAQNPSAIHPIEIVENVFRSFQKPVEEKGLSLTKKIKDSTPATITSNGLYIQEILQNFMSNALKYSKNGTIIISVEGTDRGVKFSVKDSGIGIAKSDIKNVFNKFFRSEDYRTRETSGNGLGLYITKKLAKILDAEFEVESVLNKGSTFSIIIPDIKNNSPK